VYDLLVSHAYYALFILAVLEGPLLAIACGVLVGVGFLNPFFAYGILVFGDLVPDVAYYWIGRYGATLPRVRRFATRTRLIRENFLSLETLWQQRLLQTLAAVKLAYGISPPFIVSAGLAAVPFRRFVLSSLAVSLVTLAVLMAIGFVSAKIYGFFDVTAGNAPLYISFVGLAFLAILLGIVIRARKTLRPYHKARESNFIRE
jgi:membrane protein DedA with SNARE-associated domain